jgi:hypothetical protein
VPGPVGACSATSRALKVICVSRYPEPIPVRARTTQDVGVKTSFRRVGSRAPLMSLTAAVLALLLLPTLALGAEWTPLKRVSANGNTRLDSLHQVAAAKDRLHLVHPRVGPGRTDDRVVYQRSTNDGATWSKERALFNATAKRRHVVPNLAIDARANVVVVAFRVRGPAENALLVRVSRDGGQTFGKRVELFTTRKKAGVGVPAVVIGNDVIGVAWTNRADGKVKLRTSRDDGRTFGSARTLGQTRLSIDCEDNITDGLVGLAANDKSIHVAWSYAAKRQCYASSIKVRTSLDRGKAWSPARLITTRDSFGWPELDARGKTVVATVQAMDGGLILARSAKNGRNWRDQRLGAPKGFSYSAADVSLLPRQKAVISYVKERIKKDKLVSTKLVSRRSKDDGARYGPAKSATRDAKLLRMAPNLAVSDSRITVVVQSGELDGSPRNIYASRLR